MQRTRAECSACPRSPLATSCSGATTGSRKPPPRSGWRSPPAPDSFRPMRVLVTGASGFVGRAVCRELLGRGHEVVALVRRPGSEPDGTAAVSGDIAAEGSGLNDAVAEAAPDAIVHLAAEIASQRNAARIEATNVEGTRRLVEAAKASGRNPKFVFCSTVVTGEANGELLEPDKPLPVETPYGRSKQAGERIVA